MAHFANPEAARAALERIRMRAHIEPNHVIESALENSPDPDRAIARFEHWLSAVSNPTSIVSYLQEVPPLANLLFKALASSNQIADLLAQNPELNSIATDPLNLANPPTLEEVRKEAETLWENVSDYAHALDRLRFAKQRFQVAIALADIGDLWPQPVIWKALSDQASALVQVAIAKVWIRYSQERGLQAECPVSVAAFGKLGGEELNYSSDIDLVYILEDLADEDLEKAATRFCEVFGRAVTDRMGRGSLYRIDLRLRPFGSSGPICSRMRAIESYYERYAEPWERLALIRSRVISGPAELSERWHRLRQRTVFESPPGALAVEEIVSQRNRIESLSDPNDLKRGPGGIRDIEFLTQTLQWIHGQRANDLRNAQTISTINALQLVETLNASSANSLIEAYTFLRKVEHRCQLIDDLQTHKLPEDESTKNLIARTLNFASASKLERHLTTVRSQVRDIYRQFVESVVPSGETPPKQVVETLLGSPFIEWLETLEASDAYLESIRDSSGAIDRLQKVLLRGPVLLNSLRNQGGVFEEIITGEIEEEFAEKVPEIGELERFGNWIARQSLRAKVRWCLNPDFSLGEALGALYDQVLERLSDDGGFFTVVALGSYASLSLGPTSDADIVLICRSGVDHIHAETASQAMLTAISELRRYHSPFSIDLRLRPEGKKGLLVRTIEGIEKYASTEMEMWERFALGRARIVCGEKEIMRRIHRIAFGNGLNASQLDELLKMKERIESERVAPQYRSRDIKLGEGGIDDAEWLVQLWTMFDPPFEMAWPPTLHRRCARLKHIGYLNAAETEILETECNFLIQLRISLALHGFENSVLPENPNKLSKLASAIGLHDANELIARKARASEAIRGLFLESVDRLHVEVAKR